jgi:hypothetical protein
LFSGAIESSPQPVTLAPKPEPMPWRKIRSRKRVKARFHFFCRRGFLLAGDIQKRELQKNVMGHQHFASVIVPTGCPLNF